MSIGSNYLLILVRSILLYSATIERAALMQDLDFEAFY
jgi:hypothetical protein